LLDLNLDFGKAFAIGNFLGSQSMEINVDPFRFVDWHRRIFFEHSRIWQSGLFSPCLARRKSKHKLADGKIEADDFAIDCALAAGSAYLRLRNGSQIEIVLKPHRLMVGRADFSVKGRVPGF
jgi:hypothetical protein